MRRMRNAAVLLVLVVSLMIGSLPSWGWAQAVTCGQEANGEKDLYGVFDLLIARPAAVVGGIAGAGIVILSLPFTIPTKSVDKAVNTFVKEPFRFAFHRDFPDECIN